MRSPELLSGTAAIDKPKAGSATTKAASAQPASYRDLDAGHPVQGHQPHETATVHQRHGNRGTPDEPAAVIERSAFTIPEFCTSHRLSRSALYKMWQQGDGPKFLRVGEKVLISVEAAGAWRRHMEEKAAADTEAAVARSDRLRAAGLASQKARRDREAA